MKLANLIMEYDKEEFNNIEEFSIELEKYEDEIKSNCSKAIDAFIHSDFLVRGIKENRNVLYKPQKTTKRAPVDSYIQIDNFIEIFRSSFYAKNSGNIPSRQKSAFAFKRNSYTESTNYGNSKYYVFPKDNCKLFQSKFVDDFYKSSVYNSIIDYFNNFKKDYPDVYKLLLKKDILSDYDKTNVIACLENDIDNESSLQALDAMKTCTKYFKDYTSEIKEMNNTNEVVIEGDYYLVNMGVNKGRYNYTYRTILKTLA